MNYLEHLVTAFSIAALLSLSVNLVTGYCGLVSLACATPFALGAYTYGLANTAWGWTLLPSVATGLCVSMLTALLLGQLASRFKHDQFLLVSLVLQVLVYEGIRNWGDSDAPLGSWSNMTNGPYGIKGVSLVGGMTYAPVSEGTLAVVAIALLAVSATLCFAVLSMPFGRALKAMRDDEWAARSVGKNVKAARRQAFMLSGLLSGLAGFLYAVQVTYLDPSIASIDQSVLLLSMLLIGGSGNRLLGPVCGALVFIAIPETLRWVNVASILRTFGLEHVDASTLRLFLFGLTLLLIVHMRPQGLAGTYRIQ